MRTLTTLVALLALTLSSCTAPSTHAAERTHRVIAFTHQDAKQAANKARVGFGQPPMEAVVEITCDSRTNSWVVVATPADMERVAAAAELYDQPGK